MKHLHLIAICSITLLFAAAHGLLAQDMPVPIAVQARFFKKVFVYDKTIPKDAIKLTVVVGDATPADVKDEIVEAFNSIGIKASAVKPAQLSSVGVGANVVYLAPGGDIRAVKEFCKNNGVLSISGFPSQTRNGDISISIDAVNDAPKIVINPDRLKAEKQDAAELMRLR